MTPPIFEERQGPPLAWYALGILPIGLAGWWGLSISSRLGELRWDLLVVPSLAVVLAGLIRMKTVVTRTHLRIVIVPFPRKAFDLAEVEHCEPVTYRPLLHYGGWGWRWSPSRGSAYTMRGNRGVTVRLRGGKTFLVGSQRPEELAAAHRVSTPGPTSAA